MALCAGPLFIPCLENYVTTCEHFCADCKDIYISDFSSRVDWCKDFGDDATYHVDNCMMEDNAIQECIDKCEVKTAKKNNPPLPFPSLFQVK